VILYRLPKAVQAAEQYDARLPLRYVFEKTQGLSAARNRAMAEYRGNLLVFSDDDVVMEPLWLSAYEEAEKAFPEAGYFGGRILPLWIDEKPRWLVDPSLALISGLLVHYDMGDKNLWFEKSDPFPFGANFALRRNVTEALDSFRLELGVNGGSAGRGEETEYLGRVQNLGHRGAYIGRAVCYHAQDPKRFELRYLYRYGVESGRSARRTGKGIKGSLVTEIVYYLKGFFQLCKGRGDRFRQCVINAGIQKGFREGGNSAPTE